MTLSDLNFSEFSRELTRRASGVIWEEDNLLLWAGSHPSPAMLNGAFRTIAGHPEPREVIDRARAFFESRRHGYAITVRKNRDADLELAVRETSLHFTLEMPVMVLDHRLPDPRGEQGVAVQAVSDENGVRDFARVIGEGFREKSRWKELANAAFAEPRSLLAPHIGAFVAYIGGHPVSCAMALVSHGVAGIYWVCTKPNARRRGLGAAVTAAATNAGFDLGARIASLQASRIGEPLYRRLGYVEVSRYREYQQPPPKRASDHLT